MKKLYFIVTLLFLSTATFAQSDAILNFRQVVKEIPNQFDNLKKDLLQDNTEKNYKLYSSKIEDMPISKTVISISPKDGHVYIVTFNVEQMDRMMFQIFSSISQQYINELNEMVKSGNYKGRDYNSNGENITELTDAKDQLVLQYISSGKEHLLIFYGALTK